MLIPFAMNSMMRTVPGAEIAFLSPFVIASRMPKLALEMASPWYGLRKHESEKAVVEKAAAVMEGYAAAQAEFANAVFSSWVTAVSGTRPDVDAFARAWQDILDAGLQPSTRRVRSNYKRLVSKRKRS